MSKVLSIAVIAAALGAAAAGSASAAVAQSGQNCTSPPGMNYMICDGKRVPKPGKRVVAADGSWREESREGKCVVIKEKSAAGEYKETRRCDP